MTMDGKTVKLYKIPAKAVNQMRRQERLDMIEIIAVTPNDARSIEDCGADRIELVSAFSEGGLTPSYGMIEDVVKSVSIPVNVMIRPHSKSFTYTKEELAVMKRDIETAGNLGANGVVFGVLNEAEEVCENSLRELLEVCGGLEVTFHRAIDELPDIVGGIKLLSGYPQIKTVLTSGGKGIITENIPVIKEMIKNSGHVNIMVGGGLTLDNIKPIAEQTIAPQYHFGTAVRYDKLFSGEIDKLRLKELIQLIQH